MEKVVRREILTVPEAADVLRISEKSMYNLIHSQGFPTLKVGGRMLVPYHRLMAWAEEHTNKEGQI